LFQQLVKSPQPVWKNTYRNVRRQNSCDTFYKVV